MEFRKTNTEPPIHFMRSNTEIYKNRMKILEKDWKDRVFLGLAGLLLGISVGLYPQEIPQSSPASP